MAASAEELKEMATAGDERQLLLMESGRVTQIVQATGAAFMMMQDMVRAMEEARDDADRAQMYPQSQIDAGNRYLVECRETMTLLEAALDSACERAAKALHDLELNLRIEAFGVPIPGRPTMN